MIKLIFQPWFCAAASMGAACSLEAPSGLPAHPFGALAAQPLERRRRYQQQLVLEQYGDELDDGELRDLQRTMRELELC